MTNSPDFKDESLTEFSHIDPDKHWIGETLPAPSLAELGTSGLVNATGTSPFPARADHSHDTKSVYGVLSLNSPVSVPASGNVYLSGIQHQEGTNLLYSGSTQLLIFPTAGLYSVFFHFRIGRSSGPFPANASFVIGLAWDNAAYQISQLAEILPATRTTAIYTIIDHITVNDPVTRNLQFQYQNFDSVAHNITMPRIVVNRLHGL